MSLSTVIPTSQPRYGEGYSPPRSNEERAHAPPARGEGNDSPADVLMAEFDAELTSPARGEAAPFATIIKADLAGLSAGEPWSDPRRASEPNANAVLGGLSSLLGSIRMGDAGGAREAANALQFELFSGASARLAASSAGDEAAGRMLDDLCALIRAARLGDSRAAETAARALACDLQIALIGPSTRASFDHRARRRVIARAAPMGQPSSLVQGATAAYETLMEPDAAGAVSAA
jgi:hypothetical protein